MFSSSIIILEVYRRRRGGEAVQKLSFTITTRGRGIVATDDRLFNKKTTTTFL